MEEYISRRDVIDALHTYFEDGFEQDRWWNSTHVLKAIRGVPSAQREFAKDTNVPINDCISRQAALDEIMGQPPEPHYPSWYAEQIKKLPSAKQNNTCEFWDSESSFCALNRPSVQSRNNGRWKRINDDVFAGLFKRSECGKLPPIENSEWWSVFIGGFALGMKWVKGESDGRSDKQTGGD